MIRLHLSAALLLAALSYVISDIEVGEETWSPCKPVSIEADGPTHGFITTPAFPKSYPPAQKCIYRLKSSNDALVIHLSFIEFDLEEKASRSGQCLNDFVVFIITDREGREHVTERFCGTELPDPIQTMQSELLVMFTASQANEHRGFRIRYDFIPEEHIAQPPSLYFDRDISYRKECGGSTEKGSLNGEITSPGYPSTYPRNVTCNWLVRVNRNRRIYVRLLQLELASSMAECERASLYIIDGYKHDEIDLKRIAAASAAGENVEMRFCGGQAYYMEEGMSSYISKGNRVIIRFTTRDYPTLHQTDKFKQEGKPVGFKLMWTEVKDLVQDDEETECDGFTCKGGQFCIDNGQNICAQRTRLCLNSSLMCNGVANCAENDLSDEHHCYSQHIIVSACSVIVLLIICIVALVFCQRSVSRNEVMRRVEERRSRAEPPAPNSVNDLPLVMDARETNSFPTSLPPAPPPPGCNNHTTKPIRNIEQNGKVHRKCSETSFSSEVWQPIRDPPRPPNVRISTTTRCRSSPNDQPTLYSFQPNLV